MVCSVCFGWNDSVALHYYNHFFPFFQNRDMYTTMRHNKRMRGGPAAFFYYRYLESVVHIITLTLVFFDASKSKMYKETGNREFKIQY